MLHLPNLQIVQILVITLVFILHLLTFYELTVVWGINMVMIEASVYGMYFIIKLGYLVAILTDGTFTPALEAMTRIQGAVLYNILGVATLLTWQVQWQEKRDLEQKLDYTDYLLALKGISGIIVGGLYYVDVYRID